MKNRNFEILRKLAKLHARRKRGEDKKGIVCIYDLREHEPNRKTYWLDFHFYHGSQIIYVAFVHPRMEFEELYDDLTHKRFEELYPEYADSLILKKKIVTYKKVGNSRKRMSLTKRILEDSEFENYMKIKKQIWQDVMNENPIIVKPHVEFVQTKYGILATLCVPVEIHNENDLELLKEIVLRCRKNRKELETLFPDYQYDRQTWLAEKNLTASPATETSNLA